MAIFHSDYETHLKIPRGKVIFCTVHFQFHLIAHLKLCSGFTIKLELGGLLYANFKPVFLDDPDGGSQAETNRANKVVHLASSCLLFLVFNTPCKLVILCQKLYSTS